MLAADVLLRIVYTNLLRNSRFPVSIEEIVNMSDINIHKKGMNYRLGWRVIEIKYHAWAYTFPNLAFTMLMHHMFWQYQIWSNTGCMSDYVGMSLYLLAYTQQQKMEENLVSPYLWEHDPNNPLLIQSTLLIQGDAYIIVRFLRRVQWITEQDKFRQTIGPSKEEKERGWLQRANIKSQELPVVLIVPVNEEWHILKTGPASKADALRATGVVEILRDTFFRHFLRLGLLMRKPSSSLAERFHIPDSSVPDSALSQSFCCVCKICGICGRVIPTTKKLWRMVFVLVEEADGLTHCWSHKEWCGDVPSTLALWPHWMLEWRHSRSICFHLVGHWKHGQILGWSIVSLGFGKSSTAQPVLKRLCFHKQQRRVPEWACSILLHARLQATTASGCAKANQRGEHSSTVALQWL